jgi:hypothetical protein
MEEHMTARWATRLALVAAIAAAFGAAPGTAAADDVTFVSDTTWVVSDPAPATGPAISLPGPAQKVCLNATSPPPSCPAGATQYGFAGSGWNANLSSIPGAAWIWAPGITGASAPAENDQYDFTKTINVSGTPTAGTISVAVDDFAQVFVNGAPVGTTIAGADALTTRDITAFLVSGSNTIMIRATNGPGSFAGCTNCTYSQHPAGVVFGGSITFTPAPSAVTMQSFVATRSRDGVLVRWRTESELGTLGFNVFREVNGRRVRVNARLIASKGRGAYSFLDRRAPRGKALRYWVQEIEVDGTKSWYGPIRVRAA